MTGDGDDGARTQRFVVCHNPEQAERDAQVRANLIAHLTELIDGSDTWTARRRDELVGALKAKPGLRRYLRRTPTGLLRVDAAAAKREAHLDGKWLLRTSDATLTPEDLAAAYKQLLAVEAGWRDMQSALAADVTADVTPDVTTDRGGVRPVGARCRRDSRRDYRRDSRRDYRQGWSTASRRSLPT